MRRPSESGLNRSYLMAVAPGRASGQMTHNLAAMNLERDEPVPLWSREFDAWAAEALTAQNVDALVDWRHKAPDAELAHPDDGGHYRVLLVALGLVVGSGGAAKELRFPVTGFESSMSKRCAQIA
jgi:4,5-DOPA dioxygenase extradiol